MDVVCWTETHRTDGADTVFRRKMGAKAGDTWVGFEQQNHRQHGSQDSQTRLSALLREMTQIKYFNEKLIDNNNWSSIILGS